MSDSAWTPPATADMVWIPAGPFTMGSTWFDIEGPPRIVDLPGFWIDRYPVTNREYLAYAQETAAPWVPDWPDDGPNEELLDCPVERVDWVQAVAFAAWRGMRLPAEAEWEKAARGTDARTWPWGEEFVEANANVWDSAKALGRTTIPNGALPGNVSPYGVVDLAGNVEEWVEDVFAPHPGSSASSPSASGECRVLKGGSWFYTNEFTRGSFRRGALPTFTGYELAGGPGFRCAHE